MAANISVVIAIEFEVESYVSIKTRTDLAQAGFNKNKKLKVVKENIYFMNICL